MFLCNKIDYKSAPKLIDSNAIVLYENYRANHEFNMENVKQLIYYYSLGMYIYIQ